MAPVSQTSHDVVEKQLKDAIQDLYQLMVQINAYDLAGRPSKEVLEQGVTRLESSLQKIHTTANQPTTNLPPVPPELIGYVDEGRNPDIYTREMVELTRKSNQLLKGKMEAFASFRDVLAHEMGNAMPELAEEIERVVVGTGGSADVVVKEEKI